MTVKPKLSNNSPMPVQSSMIDTDGPKSVILDIHTGDCLLELPVYVSPRPSALELYWPLMAVTICSLYFISVLPFMAPGLFLVQYYMLRYIRQKKEAKIQSSKSPASATTSTTTTSSSSSSPSLSSRLMKPSMETIHEDENEDEENILISLTSATHLIPHSQLFSSSPRRPPALFIPEFDLGSISDPVPYHPFSHTADHSNNEMLDLSLQSPLNNSSLPSIPCIARQSSHTRASSLTRSDSQSASDAALQNAMDVLKRQSSETLMAATAALFSPTLFQSLAINSSMEENFNFTEFSQPMKFPPPAPSSKSSKRAHFSFTRELPLSPIEPLTRIYTQPSTIDLHSQHSHWYERAMTATVDCI